MSTRHTETLWEHLFSGDDDETILEELFNSVTHGIAAILSAVGLYFLIVLVIFYERHRRGKYSMLHLVGCIVFGISLVICFSISTIYHGSGFVEHMTHRNLFHKLDHISIFFVIAGTYTAIILMNLWKHGYIKTAIGNLISIWSMAIGGTFLKLFYDIKDVPSWITNGLYLFMGWSMMFAAKPFLQAAPRKVFLWVLYGGLFYSGGVWFLTWADLIYNHCIWHLFVLAGSSCHYVAVVLSTATFHEGRTMALVAALFTMHPERLPAIDPKTPPTPTNGHAPSTKSNGKKHV